MNTVSLVTGANRGIGREVARQLAVRGHYVLVGGRDLAKASAESVRVAATAIAADIGRLDVLVDKPAIKAGGSRRIGPRSTVRSAI